MEEGGRRRDGRALSPVRMVEGEKQKDGRRPTQSFMHQYMVTVNSVHNSNMDRKHLHMEDEDNRQSHNNAEVKVRQMETTTGKTTDRISHTDAEGEDCQYVGTLQAEDSCCRLGTWLALIGGT